VTAPVDGSARPGTTPWRAGQRRDLLRFLAGSRHPLGFGYLRCDGSLDRTRPVELWITCRMTHVAALGLLADEPAAPGGPTAAGLGELAAQGVSATPAGSGAP